MPSSLSLPDLPFASTPELERPRPRPSRRRAAWTGLAVASAGLVAALVIAHQVPSQGALAPVAAAPPSVFAAALPPAAPLATAGFAVGDAGGLPGVLPDSMCLASGRPVIGDWTGPTGVLPDQAAMVPGFTTAAAC